MVMLLNNRAFFLLLRFLRSDGGIQGKDQEQYDPELFLHMDKYRKRFPHDGREKLLNQFYFSNRPFWLGSILRRVLLPLKVLNHGGIPPCIPIGAGDSTATRFCSGLALDEHFYETVRVILASTFCSGYDAADWRRYRVFSSGIPHIRNSCRRTTAPGSPLRRPEYASPHGPETTGHGK